MITQIGQVVATYWRRAISDRFFMSQAAALAVGIVAIAVLTIARLADPATRADDALQMEMIVQVSMLACMGFLAPALIGLHLKQQVIQVRQRRIPNAVVAHVITAVGFLVLFAVVLPAASMAASNWSWGTLGLVVALTATTFVFFTVQAPRFLLLVVPVLLIIALPAMRKWLEELLVGRHEAFALPLLSAGACGIAATLAWVLQMDEEDVGYFDLSNVNMYSRCAPTTDHAESPAASWFWRLWTPSEQRVQLWPQWAQGSSWQRIKLWSVVFVKSANWPFTAFFIVLFSAEYVWLPADRPTFMISDALFMVLYPMFCVVATGAQQGKTASIELLRPVRRSQFLKEIGLLYTYRAAVAWVLLNIAWSVPAYLFTSDAPVWGQQTFNLLAFSAACQVLLFGLTIWFMSFVGALIPAQALFASTMVVLFIPMCIRCDWRNTSLAPLLWVAPGIVVAGVLISWDAYRRWMQTELG